ncbi:hypothetical protein A6A04_00190 [Paramagnetospirillum marisnigri]|uniref:Uncharacterized protein n=1 Tax=Paramagnetospirillum marisnigri TaxID=1285242 RepID=A0A178MRS5_9PROT|nr:hypothetical protein [Paramagnetospirillum marisnigri]OAN52165.1 hypothetical protein A6A04_00190 [Paramagnetospirillum marisnigri]
MSETSISPGGEEISARTQKPKGWLARAFGRSQGVEAPQTGRNFDFNALHRSLTTLERQAKSGE